MTEAHIETTASGVVVVSPRGRLDLMTAPLLREQLQAQIQSGHIQLVVDLSAVEVIDSAGLSALIYGLKATRQAGGSLRITRPSKQVRAILKLTNLSRLLESVDPEDD